MSILPKSPGAVILGSPVSSIGTPYGPGHRGHHHLQSARSTRWYLRHEPLSARSTRGCQSIIDGTVALETARTNSLVSKPDPTALGMEFTAINFKFSVPGWT